MEKKILLIEDNKEMRENISEILELSNYQVSTAKNGKEGVELAKKNKPDLIICDIMMPVLDGYGVLHLLGKDSETSGIPFIFLTAKAERSDFRKGMEMGADDYLTKPFDDLELLKAVESRLKKSETLKQEFSKNMKGLNEFISGARNFEDLKKLSEAREVDTYKKKEVVYLSGGFPKGVFFITRGKVKTFMTNDDGKELITGLYSAGDFFGYPALLEDIAFTDSAATLDDSEICLIPKEDFFSLVYRNSEVSKKFISILSGNLHEKEEQLIRLAYNSVRKRVAEALMSLSQRYKQSGENTFSIAISRQDLANLAGTAVETTIRTLSEFKDEGLVDLNASNISVLDLTKLSKLRH